MEQKYMILSAIAIIIMFIVVVLIYIYSKKKDPENDEEKQEPKNRSLMQGNSQQQSRNIHRSTPIEHPKGGAVPLINAVINKAPIRNEVYSPTNE